MRNDRRWFLSLAGSSFVAAFTRRIRAQPPTPVPTPADVDKALDALVANFESGLTTAFPDKSGFLTKLLRHMYRKRLKDKWPLLPDRWSMLLAQSTFLGCLTLRAWVSAGPPTPSHDDLAEYVMTARDDFSAAAKDSNDPCVKALKHLVGPIEKDCVICS